MVIHLNYEGKPRDPATGAPYIPTYKEIRRTLEERLGPLTRREEMPKNFRVGTNCVP